MELRFQSLVYGKYQNTPYALVILASRGPPPILNGTTTLINLVLPLAATFFKECFSIFMSHFNHVHLIATLRHKDIACWPFMSLNQSLNRCCSELSIGNNSSLGIKVVSPIVLLNKISHNGFFRVTFILHEVIFST